MRQGTLAVDRTFTGAGCLLRRPSAVHHRSPPTSGTMEQRLGNATHPRAARLRLAPEPHRMAATRRCMAPYHAAWLRRCAVWPPDLAEWLQRDSAWPQRIAEWPPDHTAWPESHVGKPPRQKGSKTHYSPKAACSATLPLLRQ